MRAEGAKRGKTKERRYERKAWTVALTLDLEEKSLRGVTHRQIEVATHNISVGGYSFIFHNFIHPGTVVSARFDGLPNNPTLRGIVRNCIAIGGTQHRVGVEFKQDRQRWEVS